MAALLLLAMGVTSACGDSEAGKTDVVPMRLPALLPKL